MTDPIVNLQQQAEDLRAGTDLVGELRNKLANAVAAKHQLIDHIDTLQLKTAELLTYLAALEDSQVNGYLVQHEIELPKKRFAFTVKVTGTVTRTAWGVTQDEAEQSIEWDYIDPTEVDNISFDTRNGVEYIEEVDHKNIDISRWWNGE